MIERSRRPPTPPHKGDFDLIVIGGGINGAGIARDAAMRGLRVCLLEQADLCHGTTRWSSRLIHGGLRYLEHFEFGLVRESLRERETLLRIAPHLVQPLQLLIPIYRGGRRSRLAITAGMWLYDLLSRGKSLPSHEMLSAAQALEHLPGLWAEGLDGAATYYDAQLTWPERLVVENAVAAHAAGADIRTYAHVNRILTKNRRVAGVRYTDLRTDAQHDIEAATVINAAGPWVDRVLSGLDGKLPKFMGGTKGTHIVVGPFEGAPRMACYVEAGTDGRPFFILPWNRQWLIGTTDIRFDGNPGMVKTSPDEVRYLLDETNRVFPRAQLDGRSVRYHYTGVRPLPRRRGKNEGDITRRHIIRHHRRAARGLYSVIGGKLTTYRDVSEECTDRVSRRLKHNGRACRTAIEALPGALLPVGDVAAQLGRHDAIGMLSQRHLLDVYGARALEVAAIVQFEPQLAKPVCPHTHAIGAEIVFAFEKEMATTLADALLRRSMAGLAADQGRAALPKAIAVARASLGWSAARADEEERRYLREISRLR